MNTIFFVIGRQADFVDDLRGRYPQLLQTINKTLTLEQAQLNMEAWQPFLEIPIPKTEEVAMFRVFSIVTRSEGYIQIGLGYQGKKTK